MNFVHGDLKGQHMLLDIAGEDVYLVDYGSCLERKIQSKTPIPYGSIEYKS